MGRPGICKDGLAKRATFLIPLSLKQKLTEYCKEKFLLPSQVANRAIQIYVQECYHDRTKEVWAEKTVRVTFNLCPSAIEKLNKLPGYKSLNFSLAISYFIKKEKG